MERKGAEHKTIPPASTVGLVKPIWNQSQTQGDPDGFHQNLFLLSKRQAALVEAVEWSERPLSSERCDGSMLSSKLLLYLTVTAASELFI